MRRKFTTKTKERIFERDGGCIFECKNQILSPPHHCFSGSSLPEGWKRGDNINGEWNGVILCYQTHHSLHHGGVACNGKSLKENDNYLKSLAQKRYDKRKRS